MRQYLSQIKSGLVGLRPQAGHATGTIHAAHMLLYPPEHQPVAWTRPFLSCSPNGGRPAPKGASPKLLLEKLRQRLLEHSPPDAWIKLTGAAALEAGTQALEARAALHPERAAALNAITDLALVHDMMQRHDAHDPACVARPVEPTSELFDLGIGGLRITTLGACFVDHAGAQSRFGRAELFRDFATAMTEFHRDGSARHGHQRQTWVHFPQVWRVVAARVSVIDV